MEAREISRITLIVHHNLSGRAADLFTYLGLSEVYVENARCVRQYITKGFMGLPGFRPELSDTATEIFRVSVPREGSASILCRLIEGLDLQTPGRGAAYVQDVREISLRAFPDMDQEAVNPNQLLSDLALISGIQSKSGSGDNLFRVALKLGAGVPVVGLGIGTGIRDRLGLLRITISPEKELIYLMVPVHDADVLAGMLIEEAHLDRPGGGFLYRTPIRAGIVDPLVRIGRQEHAASIEQIIAAIDDLKTSTAWRRRFSGVSDTAESLATKICTHSEVSFFCREGHGDNFVHAAMQAGASGATVSRVRVLVLKDEQAGRSGSFEHGILCVPADMENVIMNSLIKAAENLPDKDWVLQSIPASSVFSHKRV